MLLPECRHVIGHCLVVCDCCSGECSLAAGSISGQLVLVSGVSGFQGYCSGGQPLAAACIIGQPVRVSEFFVLLVSKHECGCVSGTQCVWEVCVTLGEHGQVSEAVLQPWLFIRC